MKRIFTAGALAVSLAFAGGAFAADGGVIFKSKCSACHGPEGQGTAMGPAFKGNAFVKSSQADQIAQVIKNGREGAAKKYKNFAIAMPKQNLKDDEVKAVIDHIKGMASK